MKTLYLDCSMGAAGDMLAAALLELLPDREAFLRDMNGLGIPGVEIKGEDSVKCGIHGTHFAVTVNGQEEESCDWGTDSHKHSHGHGGDGHSHEHDGEGHSHGHGSEGHSHSHMHDIAHIVRDHLDLPEKVKEDILAVYGLIADAESQVHGVPADQVHFHEVGSLDAVADIAAVCLLMYRLDVDEVVVSPVHVGSGQVRCAHGILPVPAPATACILRDVPIYGGSIKGELCTPTGAALLKYFATRFGDMPPMRLTAAGYGMGKKDFEAANCVRALLGEREESADVVLEFSCNVDDMTAEEIGFAMERLFDSGALEVYTIPLGMKKSRPGTLLCVMCRQEKREEILRTLYQNTTTIGVRETKSRRYVMRRLTEKLETPYGTVRQKKSQGYGVDRSKYEYEDLARIAREQKMSLWEVRSLLDKV